MIRLWDIRDAFEGVIPSVVATTDARGMPNISYLSHVHYVDERHVALSNQFFSKTSENVRHSGMATVMVVDGRTGQQHILQLRFANSVGEGELFDRVAAHLTVTSAQQGMGEIMKLRSLDIYEVEDCRPVSGPAVPGAREAGQPQHHYLAAAARICSAISAQVDTELMLDCALAELQGLLGYGNAMVLVPDGEGTRLSTIASRGYSTFGFGSEVAVGEGTAGLAASSRRPLRISDFRRGQRYASAIREAAGSEAVSPIPLPALAEPRSQLAVPMLGRARLMGVLFVESERSYAFDHNDEEALSLVASQLATSLLLAEQERPESTAELQIGHRSSRGAADRSVHVRYFPRDGGVFFDGEYIIRGLSGRLLHHFISTFLATGQADFSNRALRREPSLQLPDFKDNLETRLILLRRRLEERGGPIQIVRPVRGQVRLECAGRCEIEVG